MIYQIKNLPLDKLGMAGLFIVLLVGLILFFVLRLVTLFLKRRNNKK
jgi:uncharacterized protein YjeT (DUF2065 family)